MYILDWNCFHDNVCSLQSLPFSKSFREIRLEGKWVPYSAYSLQTVAVFFNFPQHFIWTRTVRRGFRVFFYSKKTRKSNRLQMTLKRQHFSSVIFKDPDRELVWPGFETAAFHSVDRCLSTWSWPGGGLIHLYFTIKWICASLDRIESVFFFEVYRPYLLAWSAYLIVLVVLVFRSGLPIVIHMSL